MKSLVLMMAGVSTLLLSLPARAEIKIVTERNENGSGSFRFKNVPSPRRGDAAQNAKFTILEGKRDQNGGDLATLHDGRLPTEDDQPSANFFFDAGTEGGRIQVDLGEAIQIKQVNTYSWHGGARGPQVYKLYAREGSASEAATELKKGADPEAGGWKLLGRVDTRPASGAPGGQYGVSIFDSDEGLGKFRYLLFDLARTETDDSFGNTFYSEIDVIDRSAPEVVEAAQTKTIAKTFGAADGKYQITIDTSAAPDLTDWADKQLVPVVQEWYPKLVDMLPSDGYQAPTNFTVKFKEGMGRTPAAAGRGGISCNIDWFRKNLDGEARGSVVHEMAHVVQQYGWGRKNNPQATRTPAWLVEGIPDYLRWFKYEPQTKGAEITARNISRAKYDASYRVSGNFLNWVTENYDKQIVQKLNAAARAGKYKEALWKDYTGKTVQELGDEWKKGHEQRLAAAKAVDALDKEKLGTQAVDNATGDVVKDGWIVPFNGKNLDGWHNFKTNTVRPGWQVKDGLLVCADPHNASDLWTGNQYDWFELQLDYNISEGGNSGIIYHVSDEGRAVWATGPEVQLEDNAKAADPQRCGWLYGLYQPPDDPGTGKPLDATKPQGEWNHVRLLVTREKCEHEINGVKYFEYVLGSDDFKERVAKSKFGKMPLFAKFDKGYIALQGDHGQVSFRNIKIRPISAQK